MIENNFENFFLFSLIVGGLLWTIAIFYGPKNNLTARTALLVTGISILTAGLMVAMINNYSIDISKLPVASEIIWILMFWLAAIVLVSIQTMKEYEKQNAGDPAKFPGRGIFIPESNSWKLSGRNLIWLRKPTTEKGTEKVYEIPRNLQIMVGQTITIENGEIKII